VNNSQSDELPKGQRVRQRLLDLLLTAGLSDEQGERVVEAVNMLKQAEGMLLADEVPATKLSRLKQLFDIRPTKRGVSRDRDELICQYVELSLALYEKEKSVTEISGEVADLAGIQDLRTIEKIRKEQGASGRYPIFLTSGLLKNDEPRPSRAAYEEHLKQIAQRLQTSSQK
jgi:hypothetical protein